MNAILTIQFHPLNKPQPFNIVVRVDDQAVAYFSIDEVEAAVKQYRKMEEEAFG